MPRPSIRPSTAFGPGGFAPGSLRVPGLALVPSFSWRVVSRDSNGDPAVYDVLASYTYDGTSTSASYGQILTATAQGGTASYGYDAKGAIASVTSPRNSEAGGNPATTYTTNAFYESTAVTAPGNSTTGMHADGAGRTDWVKAPDPLSGSPSDGFKTLMSYNIKCALPRNVDHQISVNL